MNLGKYPQCENGRNLLSQFFHEKLREIKVFVSKITLKAVFTKYFFLVRANFLFFHTVIFVTFIQFLDRWIELVREVVIRVSSVHLQNYLWKNFREIIIFVEIS